MTYKYDRFTYAAKVVILLLIFVSILLVIFNRPKEISAKQIDDNVNSKAQVTVTKSVFSSTGDNSYKILAERITQDEDGVYSLNAISGGYHLDNDDEIDMKANSGKFDSVLDIAHLENDVKINYLGYDLMADRLDLNLKNYSASSPANVQVQGIGGSIEAESFKTTDKFNQIIFHGDVKADFTINNDRKR